MTTVQIKLIGDEQIVVLVNGNEIGSANHDEDGWAGLGKVESIVEALANALGVSFERIYD